MTNLPPRDRSRLVFLSFLTLVLLAAGAGTALLVASPHEEVTLDNGMRVLLLPHRGSGMVASNVFVGAGSTREEDRYAGSSHFLEHVLFNGTTRRTQEELYAAADRIGAYNNATTKQEYTHYMMVAPAEHLAEALDIQADMLLHSTLPVEKFEKERGIVLEELSKDKDDPDFLQERVLAEMLYGAASDFARPVLGTEQTITALPRDAVVEYYHRQYVPSNMRMVLMGDFDRGAALDLVRRTFAVDPSRAGSGDASLPAPSCELGHAGRAATQGVNAPKTVVELVAALPVSSPEEEAPLALLAHVAGGTESSRLERALDYEPALQHEDASASVAYREGRRLLVLSTRLSGDGAPLEAAGRMLATLRSLSEIGQGELAAARTSLLSNEVSQLEKLHYYALFEGDRLWHMPAGYTPRYLAAIEETEAAALAGAAERLLDGAQLQVVSAGPGVETASVEIAALELSPEILSALRPPEAEAHVELRRQRPAALPADEPPAVLHLDNGLTVVHAAAASTRMFALHLLVKNRSLREPENLAGIADLLHRSLPAVLQAEGGGPSRLDRAGATLKVADNPWIPYDDYYTTPLYSFIRLECVDEYFQEALQLLAQMLAGPHDDEDALEESRRELISAIERAGARPSNKSRARLSQLLFPGHPLARAVMGSTKSLAGVTPETLEDFAGGYFRPDQLVLAIVGNVPRDQALSTVNETLGRLEPAADRAVDPGPPPLTVESVREEIEGGGEQSSLRMGRVVDVEPEDRWALTAAAQIASGHMQQDLRETRGLAYSLGIWVTFYGDRAALYASMATRPENLAEAEAGMRSYFARGEFETTADEVETAVNKHLSRMRMRRITSMGQAFTLSRDLVQCGGIDFSEREAKGMASVTPADVKRVAARYLSAGPTVTVIAR